MIKAIPLKQQQMDKFEEYKDILINRAVTGKIKVPSLLAESIGTAQCKVGQSSR